MDYSCLLSYKECKDGKIVPKCEIVCPYPWYARLCLSRCNCTQDHCDSAYGCFGKYISSRVVCL